MNYQGILQSQGGECYCCQGEEKVKYSGRLYPFYSPLTGTLVGIFCPMCIILIKHEYKYDVYKTQIPILRDKINRVKLSHRLDDINHKIARYIRVANVVNKIHHNVENKGTI